MKLSLYIFFFLAILSAAYSQKPVYYDTIQYPIGYPNPSKTVIQQLSSYPLPRYNTNHNLQHLFNWMDPYFMGGRGQKGISNNKASSNANTIQKELIANWHYGIVIPNAGVAFNGPLINGCPLFINLANQNPKVPLHVITFWTSVKPKLIGFSYSKALINTRTLDSSLYATFDFYNKPKREISYNFPDSLIQIDGHTQKFNLNKIIKCLTRPINIINENGEEAPGPYQTEALKRDSGMVRLKKEMRIDTWKNFMATRKLHMRMVYASSFMDEIPELKETKFNFYATEGGPINRFEWHIMKKIMTPVNGIYYSTPDFYPRWPGNWKEWKGAWHGWKWIEEGRKKEIKNGDYLFSPFIAAGWSKKQEDDIRPGQWLGLLKCLGVIGAEFYYVAYFNLSAPFTDPSQWAWQAAIPAYAQAITSCYEDVLKNGNLLLDEKQNPLVTYKTNDKHVLVTVRKHNEKEKYIICGTYQPFSNEINALPDKKEITLKINNQNFTFYIRRQGSVYVYEKTAEDKVLFYQLDSWHENSHPDRWSKDFYFEAEVSDTAISNTIIFTTNQKENNFSNCITYLKLEKNEEMSYKFTQRDSTIEQNYLWIRYKGEGSLLLNINKNPNQEKKVKKTENWKWDVIKLIDNKSTNHEKTLVLKCKKGIIYLDKFVISSTNKVPDI